MTSNPKFLVTGASGFIGSHLTSALVKKYGADSVTAMVRPNSGPHEDKALNHFRTLGVNILECDLLELPSLDLPRPEFDVLYHLAGYAITEDSEGPFEVNSIGTRNLLNWLGDQLLQKRVIYGGTLASFDKRDPDVAITEETECAPLTPYGKTKLEGEKIIQIKAFGFGYSYTILKLCTIVGPGFRSGGMFGVFPEMLRRNAFPTRLNWPGRVSFLSVSDLVKILLKIPELPQTTNQVYVTSNEEALTFDLLLEQMATVLRTPRQRISLPSWIWKGLGTAAWLAASSKILPPRKQIFFWRLSHLIRNGLYADASQLNALYGHKFQSIREALQQAYDVQR